MRVSAAPFRAWVERKAREYGTLEALNHATGHDLHKHLSGQYSNVDLDLVDDVLTTEGSTHLSSLYPDLYDGGVDPAPKRRGGWKRPDKWCRYSKPQLRLLYKLHVEQHQSINSLAKRTYAALGYSSHGSSASAISAGWKRMGLPARDRIEMVRAVCTKHGLAPKHGPRPGYQTYRRRVLAGEKDQPRCKGFKSNPPRKGWPCQQRAMFGSDYCHAHDPLRLLQHQAQLARMRARIRRPEMLPMGPFSRWLDALAEDHGSLKAACAHHGLRYDSACRYRKGEGTDGRPKATISRGTVEGWLEAVGLDVGDLYAEALVA